MTPGYSGSNYFVDVTFTPTACVGSCDGKTCGDDGCGNSCGTCPGGHFCLAGGTCGTGKLAKSTADDSFVLTRSSAAPDNYYTAWNGLTPAQAFADPAPYQLGMAFTPLVNGDLFGVMFYLPAGSTQASRTVSLWSASAAQPLATAETATLVQATGYHLVTFASPVSLTAGTRYTVSVDHVGRFAVTRNTQFGFTVSDNQGVSLFTGADRAVSMPHSILTRHLNSQRRSFWCWLRPTQ